jgi:hypothetical protein
VANKFQRKKARYESPQIFIVVFGLEELLIVFVRTNKGTKAIKIKTVKGGNHAAAASDPLNTVKAIFGSLFRRS